MTKTTVAPLSPQTEEIKLNTGLDDDYVKGACEKLSEALVNTYKLMIKSQICHWNVVGPMFKSVHELTEEHYNELFAALDTLAERVRALGELAPTNIAAGKGLVIEVSEKSNPNAMHMLQDLIHAHEETIVLLRSIATYADEHEDHVTADMLTERLTFHETALWMLKATTTS